MSKTDDKILRLPADAHAALKEMAKDDKRSMAQQMAFLIQQEEKRRELA